MCCGVAYVRSAPIRMNVWNRVRCCESRRSGVGHYWSDFPDASAKTGLDCKPVMRHNAAMASDRKTVDFIVEQIAGAGVVSARPMFGEYGVYCDGKMVAIIGDDQLFLRPTSGGRAFAAEAEEVSPYPGAKPHLLID